MLRPAATACVAAALPCTLAGTLSTLALLYLGACPVLFCLAPWGGAVLVSAVHDDTRNWPRMRRGASGSLSLSACAAVVLVHEIASVAAALDSLGDDPRGAHLSSVPAALGAAFGCSLEIRAEACADDQSPARGNAALTLSSYSNSNDVCCIPDSHPEALKPPFSQLPANRRGPLTGSYP